MHFSQVLVAAACAAVVTAAPLATPSDTFNVLLERSTTAVVNSPNAVTTINDNDGVGAGSSTYTSYSGNGVNWPAKSKWMSFSNMWSANQNNILNSCGWNGWKNHNGVTVPNTSQTEAQYILNAIQSIAKSSGVDHRMILAVLLQESEGCVRVPSTNNGVLNTGLMQSHAGNGTCNDTTNMNKGNYAMSNPCPQSAITQMVKDGAVGTASGDGLASLINKAASDGYTGATVFYRAARYYNSGSVCNNDLSNACGATASYASDIANRLTGWHP